MQIKVSYKFVTRMAANDIDSFPEEVMDKQFEEEMPEDIDEATLREVAAQLRRIGDELNEVYAVKQLQGQNAPSMFGARRFLSLLTNMKL